MKTPISITVALLWVLLGWINQTSASTVSTRASLAIAALRTAVSAHIESGGKIGELSQASLAKYIKQDVADDLAQGDFWARFQLLPTQQVEGPMGGDRIIAVIAFKVAEDRRESVGRYVLLSDVHGVSVEWIAENDLVGLFSKAKVPLFSKGVWQQAHAKAQSAEAEPIPNPAQQKAAEDRRRADLIAQDESYAPTSKRPEMTPQINQNGPQASPPISATPHRSSQVGEATTISPNDEKPDSPSWAIFVVMVAAAIGLLWLMLKKRK